jgi:hypothetical protein
MVARVSDSIPTSPEFDGYNHKQGHWQHYLKVVPGCREVASFLLQGKSSLACRSPLFNGASQAWIMHLTLAILFCSLISVSVGAGDGPDDAPQYINVHEAALGEVTALQAGRIIAVKPNDMLVSRHYTLRNTIVR